MVRRPDIKTTELFRMRKLIIATAAVAFLSSTAFAQDKADKSGTTAAPAATSSDTMSKDSMKKMKKTKKKSAKKTGDDAAKDATKQ
jgi:hypothetical protein